MSFESGFRFFKEDLCDRCGICFERCPVLELGKDRAKQEIEALIKGDTGASLVLQNCVTCNACDFVCPQQANPYGLILERHNLAGRTQGLPYIARFIFPNEPENMWTTTRVLMGEDELKLLHSWEENLKNPRKEVLLTGFYNNLLPYIAQTSLLDELKPAIAGSDSMFGIGEDAYRIGFLEEAARLGRLAKQKFSDMGIEKMYCFMVVEASMFTDVLPKKFGIDFDFEVDLLDNWILDRLKDSKIQVKKSLNMSVTVHDNCCGRYMDGVLQDTTREIMDRVGCRVIEMQHIRENALCCGWAGTVPTLFGPTSGNPVHTLLNLLQSLYLRLQEAEATGADALVVPCPGCCAFLSLIKVLTNSRMEVYLPIELVQLAAGETPVHKHDERAWDILAVTTNLILKWPFSARRFFPRPVDIEKPLPQAGRGDAMRIRLLGKLYHSALVQNRVSRSLIARGVKALINRYRVYLETKKRKDR
ncbi:MAG: (Fe-S)-binding protein [Deltaproteobacteria bacterium]|nr:(Fe-S)-binding protein [Deltaproteobacteria bacterium]